MTSAPLELEPVTDARFAMSSIGDIVELGNVRESEGIKVRAMVPGDHEAYLRILHPAWSDRQRQRHTTWSEIAASTGAQLAGTVAFRRITVAPGSPVPKGPQGAWDEDATPVMGTLPRAETEVLIGLLSPAPSCWFVMWNGWDGLRLDPRQVTVGWQGNPYLVYRGPVDVVRGFDWTGRWQAPHLWLPEDRTWCVGTDMEGFETYVAGSARLIEQLEGEPRFETIRVSPEGLAIVFGDWLITD